MSAQEIFVCRNCNVEKLQNDIVKLLQPEKIL